LAKVHKNYRVKNIVGKKNFILIAGYFFFDWTAGNLVGMKEWVCRAGRAESGGKSEPKFVSVASTRTRPKSLAFYQLQLETKFKCFARFSRPANAIRLRLLPLTTGKMGGGVKTEVKKCDSHTHSGK